MVKVLKFLISITITILFLYFLDKYVGFENIKKFFNDLSIFNISIAFLFYLISYIIRSYRWSFTLDIKDFKKLFHITAINTFFNIILPFRTGEFSFFYMLKKENIHISDITMSFITTRAFDGIGLIAILLFSYFLYIGNILFSFLSLILLPFLFYIFIFILSFIKHEKVKEFNNKRFNFLNLAVIYLLSILTFLFKFIAFYFVLPESLNINIIQSFIASSGGDLTTVLPIHGIAGIGSYETGYAGILIILLNIDKNLAFIASLFAHIFIILSSSIIAFISYLLKKL